MWQGFVNNYRLHRLIPLLIVFLSLGFGIPTPVMAQELAPVVYSTNTAELIITAHAIKYGILAQPLIDTLKCESDFDSNAEGDFSTTTMQYTSFGIAQIHLSAHQDITKEQALDPLWSIDFAARQFKLGNTHIWSCFNKLYGSSSP